MRIVSMFAASILSVLSGSVHADPLSDLAASAGKDADALIRVGNLMVEAGRLSDARKAFKQAQWKSKDNPEARLGIIRISMAEGKFQESKHFCRKLAQAHPKSPTGDICSGLFWLGNDRSSRAVDDFEKAAIKGDIARGKTGIGDAESKLGQWDEAVAAYNEALVAGAGYQAHLGLGLALEKQGKEADALESLKQAAAAENASALAHYHLGRLLGKGPEAVKELTLAAEIRPKWFDALSALGDVREQNGESAEAEAAYRQAIAVDNNRAPAYFGLATALRAQKKNEEALKALQEVVDRIPNHARAYLLFAEIFYEQKQTDKAIEALDRARDVASGDISVFIRSAEIYYDAGRMTNARAFLNQALSMDSKLSKAHAMLGDIACERKRYDEGRKHYDSALKGDRKNIDVAAVQKKQAACKK